MNTGRRNYAFDNYRKNRLNERRRNVDDYFNRNFGQAPRRSNRTASVRASHNLKNNSINAPNQLRAPRTGGIGNRRGNNNNNNNNNHTNNKLRNSVGFNNRGRGKIRLGRRPGNNNRNNTNNNNNNNIKNNSNNGVANRRGRNQQRRRDNNQENLIRKNQPKQNTKEKRVLRRSNGPIGKLELSNLSPDIMNKDLIEIFSVYGRLKRCAVIFQDNQSTGRGVVQYDSRANAQRAYNDLQGTNIKNSFISINYVGKKKKETPENNENIPTTDINMEAK